MKSTQAPALVVDDIAKSYGPVLAVDGISFEVKEGEVLGFLGPNGAGKTTSLRIICGELRPDRGKVLIKGRDASSRRAGARLRLGVSPQDVVLWDMLTCTEQLELVGEMYGLPRRTARRRSMELLEAMGLSGAASRLARTLSGGMRRRLNVAMALVHDPEIVLLDEPEAGLDPQSRVLVRSYIRSLARSKTIILSTHNMDEADRLADRVAIIDHGKLLTLDTPEALKRRLGEGDVLEIDLDRELEETTGLALPALEDIAASTLVGRTLVIRCLGAALILASVMERLRASGLHPGEVRLRQSALEDVFISLTGKGLRE